MQKLALPLCLMLFVCCSGAADVLAQNADFYVAPSGKDTNPGTLGAPFATMDRARQAVDALKQSDPQRTTPIVVMFREGTYFLPSAQNFTSVDSGTSTLGLIYENYPGENPVISGGIRLTGWQYQGGNLWTVQLPAGTQNFEQLWYNGARRLRPRLGSSTVGTYYRVQSPVYTSKSQTNCTVQTSANQYECFDRFKYSSSDPISSSWQNLSPPSGNPCGAAGNSYPTGDIEVVFFERWNVSKMRISCIDTSKHIIYFTGPTSVQQDGNTVLNQAPIAGHRYIVENIKDELNQPEQWFVDRSTTPWTLTYYANSGENPNTDTVIIPQASQIMVASYLQYVTFMGLTFANDNWTIPAAGYPSTQQDPTIPTAISCQNCKQVTFDTDTVTQTSGGGLEFVTTDNSSTTSHNTIQNGAFYDIGAMGVRIGQLPLYGDTDANVAQFTTVKNNAIEGFGRVIASAPGLSQGDGHDNLYTHNDIFDGYQDGIELCAPACVLGTSNSHGLFNNTSSFNHIYNLGQGLTDDLACIYYDADPSSTGNQILNNKCHDVLDASVYDSDGYAGQGYYLDSNTASVLVENNLAYRLSSSALAQTCGPQSPGTANTIKNNIFAFFSHGAKQEGCTPPKSGVLQFNYTNNLIYYESHSTVQSGCAYSSGKLTLAQNYASNLYCYASNADCSLPSTEFFTTDAACSGKTSHSFSAWQALGEDSGSMVAQPMFQDPYYPADNFALQGGSPAGRVGFVAFDVNAPGRTQPASEVPAVPATFPTYAIEGVTQTQVTSSLSPSTYGQSLTLTATVSSVIGPPPSGEVITFYDGGVPIATGTSNAGVATFKTSTLSATVHAITASYGGDSMWAGSTSNTFNQWVGKATTTTTLSSSKNPSTVGQSVTFTAKVTSTVVPTGTVTFKANGVSLGTVTLNNGTASITTSTLKQGNVNIMASYAGNDSFQMSSQTLQQVVNK